MQFVQLYLAAYSVIHKNLHSGYFPASAGDKQGVLFI